MISKEDLMNDPLFMGEGKPQLKMKRLVVTLTEDDHKEIKMRAAQRKVSIKVWVLRAIAQMIIQEKKYE